MSKLTQHNAAWGLEIGGSAARLVRVSRRGEGFVVDRCHTAAIPEHRSPSPRVEQALAALPLGAIGDEPLAVCISDQAVLYRRLVLPAAEPEAFKQMVEAQAEALLPLSAEAMAWGWGQVGQVAAEPEGERAVLLCGTRREAVGWWHDQQATPRPALVTTSALAMAGGASVLLRQPPPSDDRGDRASAAAGSTAGSPEGSRQVGEAGAEEQGGRTVVVDVAARCTTLAVLGSVGLEHCGVVDQGGDDWIEAAAQAVGRPVEQVERLVMADEADHAAAEADPALGRALSQALRAWRGELIEVYRKMLDDLGGASASRCVVVGRASRVAGAAQATARALGLGRVTLGGTETEGGGGPVEMPEGASMDEALSAVGAALHLLAPPTPMIRLDEDRKAASEAAGPIRRWPRMVAAAVVALAALLGWYALDLWQADRLEAQVQSLKAQTRRVGGLDRALALDGYLQQKPAPPLLILETISDAASEKVLLKRLRYDNQGRLRLGGEVRGVKNLDTTLNGLTAAPSLREVELQSASVEHGKWSFQIQMAMTPLRLYLAFNPRGAGGEGGSGPPPETRAGHGAGPGATARPGAARKVGAQPSGPPHHAARRRDANPRSSARSRSRPATQPPTAREAGEENQS